MNMHQNVFVNTKMKKIVKIFVSIVTENLQHLLIWYGNWGSEPFNVILQELQAKTRKLLSWTKTYVSPSPHQYLSTTSVFAAMILQQPVPYGIGKIK